MDLKKPDLGQNTPFFPDDGTLLVVNMVIENLNTFTTKQITYTCEGPGLKQPDP